MARNCGHSSHEDERFTWSAEYCNFGCVDDGQRAYCAATPDADTKCGQAPDGPGICLGTTATSCVSGFPITGGSDCASGSKVCAERDGKVFCALSLDPDPRCADSDSAAETWTGCADRAVVDCRFGLATYVEPCPVGHVCRPTTGGRATCAAN